MIDTARCRSACKLGLTAIVCLAVLCGCGRRSKSHLQEGIEKLRDGRFEAAATLLELAAESAPDNASVHCNLGLAYWKLQQTSRAIREFKTADRLLRNDERPLEFLGQIYIAEHNLDEARRTFELAAQRAPLSARILTSQAVVANHAGDFDQARTFLESALDVNPGYLPALFNMGLLYRGPLDDKEAAATYFARFLRMAPDGPRKELAQRLMGLPSATQDENTPPPLPRPAASPPPPTHHPVPQAAPTRQPVPQVAPARDVPPAAQSEPKPVMPVRDPAAAVLDNARKAMETGELDTALILLNQCVKQYPDSADAQWLLAVLYDKHLAYREKADEAYQAFRTRFPDDPRAEALAPPTPHPAAAPPRAPARQAGKPSRDPEAARQALRRGVRFYQAKEWQNAIDAYQQALALDDQTTDALYNLGLAYKAVGQSDKARDVLERTVKMKPDMLTARYMLAVVYRDLEQNAAAIEQLDVVLENDPHYSKAHLLLGLLYRAEGRLEEARRHIQRYVNMEPDAKSVNELKGWLESQGE